MLTLTERIHETDQVQATLTLPFDQRQKSRFLTQLDDGGEVGLVLERGQILRGGDLLRADNGMVVKIQAAAESVSSVYSTDPHLLSRASYHLGNRHVPLQIEPGCLRYQHDHVLDDMVRGLGLQVKHEHAPFEPEAGAYAHAAHAHSHHHHHD